MATALSSIGIIHTAIGVVAVGAGALALLRDGRIAPASGAGLTYISMTVLTCLSGLFIFAHGGFGKPHALAVLTLLVLLLAGVAHWSAVLGRRALAVETVALSLTFFLHLIPAVTETLTRLPVEAPLAHGPDAPVLAAIIGVLFLLFLAGAAWQLRQLQGGVSIGAIAE